MSQLAPSFSPCNGASGSNERRRSERRYRSHHLTHWHWGFRGRRHTARRAADQVTARVDHYPNSLFVVVLGVFLLSQADSVLTLMMVGSGRFVEMNPFMGMLLEWSPEVFVNVRSLLWGLVLVALVTVSTHHVFGKLRTTRVIYGLFIAYAVHSTSAVVLLQLVP